MGGTAKHVTWLVYSTQASHLASKCGCFEVRFFACLQVLLLGILTPRMPKPWEMVPLEQSHRLPDSATTCILRNTPVPPFTPPPPPPAVLLFLIRSLHAFSPHNVFSYMVCLFHPQCCSPCCHMRHL